MADQLGTAFAVTAMGTTVSVFPAFLPRLEDVRKCDKNDKNMAGDVRLGEVASVGIALTVGFMLSQMSGSSLPLFTAALICAVIVGVYEFALSSKAVA